MARTAECLLKRTAGCAQLEDQTLRAIRLSKQEHVREEKDQGFDECGRLKRERLDGNQNEVRRVLLRSDGDTVDVPSRDVQSSGSDLFQRSVDAMFTAARALEQRIMYGNIFYLLLLLRPFFACPKHTKCFLFCLLMLASIVLLRGPRTLEYQHLLNV